MKFKTRSRSFFTFLITLRGGFRFKRGPVRKLDENLRIVLSEDAGALAPESIVEESSFVLFC